MDLMDQPEEEKVYVRYWSLASVSYFSCICLQLGHRSRDDYSTVWRMWCRLHSSDVTEGQITHTHPTLKLLLPSWLWACSSLRGTDCTVVTQLQQCASSLILVMLLIAITQRLSPAWLSPLDSHWDIYLLQVPVTCQSSNLVTLVNVQMFPLLQ